MERSKIAWTDYSGGPFNFVLRGKAKGDCEVSPGCANCYAYAIRRRNQTAAPDQTTFSHEKLEKVRTVKLSGDHKRGPGSKPLVFVVDMGDLFHPLVPDDFIHKAFDVMAAREAIDFQVLTKRAERMANIIRSVPENIWLGVTVENQQAADKRLPFLKSINAAVRFVSCEPLLEPVKLDLSWIRWLIVGGESGAKRRAFDKQWAEDLRLQCQQSHVAFFFKQGGHQYPGRDDKLNGQAVKQWPTV